ncbi:MAG: hypothetical protein GXY64_06865 [Bacteroidales bacterium]|nr:hypothetical protein [Bacteroidales bacterium]
MKKFNLLFVVGMVSALPALAQTNILTMGFEDGDKSPEPSPTQYALSPNYNANNTVADWVNVKETDNWNDKSSGAHTGEYCFVAENAGAKGYSWDRGLKFGLGELKLETPYRVSFWVKADPTCTYTNDAGTQVTEDTEMTSWLSKGMENFDLAFPDPTNNGNGIGLSAMKGFTGEWQRVSFVTYNPTREYVKSIVDGRSWVGNATFPAKFGGAGETYKSHFQDEIPEMYFFIANLYSPATYYIDDISVDENVTVKDVLFGTEIIKINFGWKNNISTLAKANQGTISLDPSQVTVTVDGTEAEVSYFEGKEDGCLYIFMAEAIEGEDVTVSFKGDERIIYTSQLRPTADTGENVAVLPFSNEKAIKVSDEEVDAVALAWGSPVMKSSTPENKSFNLTPEDVKTITVTYSAPIEIKNAKAVLKRGVKTVESFGGQTMELSEDARTITFNVTSTDLVDGSYTLEISNVQNSLGDYAENATVLEFELGGSAQGGEAVEAYRLDMTDLGANSLPMGWSGTSDNSDREAKGAPSTGLSGAPRIMGDNTKANQGIYWGARGGSAGVLAFGKYAAEASIGGQLPADILPEEALHLTAGPQLLTFKNASWDSASGNVYAVKVCNAEGEEIFSKTEITPTETIGQGPADGVITLSEFEFEVPEDGYYYVQFDGNTGWACWLLTSLSVTAKPESSSGYYNKALADAIASAESVLAANADEKYDGDSKTALASEIEKQKNAKYTSPSQVEAAVAALNAAANALSSRATNYNDFVNNFASAKSKYEDLAEKYKTTDVAKATEKAIAQYDNVDPKSLNDAELATAAAAVKNLPGLIDNVVTVTGIVTKRAQLASELAASVGDEESLDYLDALASDDTGIINNANIRTTAQIYSLLGDDRTALEVLKVASYDTSITNEDFDETDPEQQATHDENGHPLIVNGVNFSGYVKNPNFYTYQTNFDGGSMSETTFPGWTWEPAKSVDDEGNETTIGSAKPANNWTSTTPTETNPVVTAALNAYGASAEYKISQVVENLPVGIYDIIIGTRTGTNTYTPEAAEGEEAESILQIYNAQNPDTGIWDKYIFAQVDDEEPMMAPFAYGATNFEGLNTYLRKVKITKPGQKLTIGAVENYTSGLAVKGADAMEYWDTNTYVKNAKIYFVNPDPTFDYAKAAADLNAEITTDIKSFEAPAVKTGAAYNLSGQKVGAEYKGIVIINGKKILRK